MHVPNGLGFSEFSGYEDWQVVAVSQTTIPQIGDLIEVILANPVMIEAYRAGVTGSNKHYPDGSKMAKIHWNVKQSAEAPTPTTVPDTCMTSISWSGIARDFPTLADGDTPSLTMTAHPTRSRPLEPAPSAGSRVTR